MSIFVLSACSQERKKIDNILSSTSFSHDILEVEKQKSLTMK